MDYLVWFGGILVIIYALRMIFRELSWIRLFMHVRKQEGSEELDENEVFAEFVGYSLLSGFAKIVFALLLLGITFLIASKY